MIHKVLCLDDELHNLEALERLLRKKYQVFTVDSGQAGLDVLKDHSFSAIISDQKMPVMTGVEFFSKAKLLQPDAIRILLTGYTDLESVIDAINQGQIYRYITKPWEPDELLTTLHQALEVFELKQTIREQNRELVKANQALMSLDKLKTDFMAVINHELKTPLTGISSYVQLLGEEKLTHEQKLYVQKIEQSTERLQQLIHDTLLITKLRSETFGKNEQEVSPLELARKVWDELTQKKSSNLKLKLAGDALFLVKTDPHNFSILLGKLLHNCQRYSLEQSEVTVELQLDSQGGWSLTLHSQAKKDPPENVASLLEAFGKNQNVLHHGGGAGLGLAVAQSITLWLGGEMSLQVKDRKWTVSLRWPDAKAQS